MGLGRGRGAHPIAPLLPRARNPGWGMRYMQARQMRCKQGYGTYCKHAWQARKELTPRASTVNCQPGSEQPSASMAGSVADGQARRSPRCTHQTRSPQGQLHALSLVPPTQTPTQVGAHKNLVKQCHRHGRPLEDHRARRPRTPLLRLANCQLPLQLLVLLQRLLLPSSCCGSRHCHRPPKAATTAGAALLTRPSECCQLRTSH